ncbi:hypothetical protein [Neolewinella antarctica]|uniref:Outer membrane protein beta-barrel domain-containing protein n=1 Tax=Neolewinella antarctica TaxID=442734 RepID=A0ABX0XER9_9BACT|nr:hypothetical protein [Neolewinella antarctica]NJC27736.1 hypothetical protein [Neolewinella antarctica]
MKNIRCYWLAFALALPFALTGQTGDYLITAARDTIFGKLIKRDLEDINHGVYFRPEGSEFQQLYLPPGVREFRSKKTGTYVSTAFLPSAAQVFSNKQYFLKPLVTGDAEVYSVRLRKIEKLATGDEYNYWKAYLVAQGGDIDLFQSQAELRAYRQQTACPLPDLSYAFEDASVSYYFVAATECAGDKARLLEDEIRINSVSQRLRIYVDAGYYSYTWSPNFLGFFQNQVFQQSNRLDFSLHLGREIIPRLHLLLGLTVASYDAEATISERIIINFAPLDTTYAATTIKQTVLAPGLYLNYYVPLGRSATSLYVRGGLRYALTLSGETTYARRLSNRSIERRTYKAGESDQAPSDFVQVVVGAGVQFELGKIAPYLEARYNNGQGVIKEQTFLYEELGINFGIRF